jgi:hypothetical protein
MRAEKMRPWKCAGVLVCQIAWFAPSAIGRMASARNAPAAQKKTPRQGKLRHPAAKNRDELPEPDDGEAEHA